jgi:hemerythrin-like domain-containing protein
MRTSRRCLLALGATAGLAELAARAPLALGAEANQTEGVADVSPTEDLMREHGVLKRILLVYNEAARRLDANEALPPDILPEAAGIIRAFIEDYHEKLEEGSIFPRFKKAGKLTRLVDTLLEQHRVGRRLTDVTLRLSAATSVKSPENRRSLADSLRLFVRMYSPHEAREDTVLFPALHQIVSAKEFDAMGDEFERREQELFGKNGFETIVDRVAAIENKLGIFDLAQFTARV